ncbi:MASE1 domain-containing protein [Pseudoalteromonas tunicata]|uniref:MASE1 domain-containing protein n=1 Tax=Pseudoalteromonas tunicata TaxID=314281 RepID=UPI00273E435C|nr:MASE1 domain-containing protein [Pseudoalteromonas tunicata]MDP5215072.1 MASE1 domain-containing protein [Pseudoalteromonas tunicata]
MITMHTLRLNIFFTLAYFAAAWLTLSLSQHGGYISPIWPASGVALTAVLLYGYRLLPSVWFASSLVNSILTDFQFPMLNLVFIATAVTLQAWGGCYLLSLKKPFNLDLINRNDIAWFALCAFLSTLIASSLASLSLYLTGNIPLTQLPYDWLTWWIGDSFGIILFCPMLLGILLKDKAQWQSRRYIINISFSLMLVFTFTIYSFSRDYEFQRLDNLIQQQSTSVSQALEQHITSHINALYNIRSLQPKTDPIADPDYALYMQDLLTRNEAFVAISRNRLINSSTDLSGNLTTPYNRQVIVESIYPYQQNKQVIGIDIYQETFKRNAIDLAIKNKSLVATQEVSILQNNKNELAILLLLPYLVNNEIAGFITGVLDIGKFTQLAFTSLNFDDLDVKLLRVNEQNKPQAVLFDSTNNSNSTLKNSVTELTTEELLKKTRFKVGDQSISLLIKPTEQWLKDTQVKQYWLILIPCLILISIIGNHILIMTGDHFTIKKLVAIKEHTNQALLNTNTELETVLNSLKVTQKKLIEREKFAELGHLVAGVAHEINTPLGISITGSTLLTEQVDDLLKLTHNNQLKKNDLIDKLTAILTAAELVNKNNHRAAILVSRFKELAVNKDSELRSVFAVKPFLQQLMDSFEPKTRQHTVLLQCPTFSIDSFKTIFHYIFSYLINGSIEHGFVDVEHGEISINIALNKHEIRIDYCDNGVGIARNLVKNIFVPFYTTKRNLGATGLGGAIFFNIVTQILNGTVDCDSDTGKGVTITVTLPIPNDSIQIVTLEID